MARTDVVLSEFREEEREAGAMFITCDDGTVVSILPALLFPSDFSKITETDDHRLILSAVMGGEDQLDRFLAGGGTPAIGMRLLRKHLGLDVGPSPASSTTSTDDGTSSRPTSDASTT